MNNKALLNELAKHLTILEYHVNRLKKKPEQLHEIDIEVMSEKLKEIYTLIHGLDTGEAPVKEEVAIVNEVEKVPLVEVKPEAEIPTPKAPEMSTESEVRSSELNEEKLEDIPVPRPPDPEPIVSTESEVRSTELIEEKPEDIPVPRPADPEPIVSTESEVRSTELIEEKNEEVPVPRPPDPVHPKTTADLFSGPTTIADTFQAAGDNTIAAKTYPQVEQDLKMAIGINDKFLFINELFKGDPGIYNQAIETLNSVEGLNDAETAIESYRGEYAWADNSEAYHRLKNIVMSKYDG